jgi:hypothetical protein
MTNNATTTANDTAISDALDQIANTATNNSSLLATMVAQLAALSTCLDTMQCGGTTPATTTSTTPPANATTPTPQQVWQPQKVYTQAEAFRRFNPIGYCSTHGYRVVALHTSETCQFRGSHYNENATWADTKK